MALALEPYFRECSPGGPQEERVVFDRGDTPHDGHHEGVGAQTELATQCPCVLGSTLERRQVQGLRPRLAIKNFDPGFSGIFREVLLQLRAGDFRMDGL